MTGRKCFRRKGRAISGMLALAAVFAVLLGVQAAWAGTTLQLYQYAQKWGTLGTGNLNFNNPSGIAMDGTNVYVVDTNNNRVQVFDVTTGNYLVAFLGSFGTSGTGDGQFSNPTGSPFPRS